MAQFDPERWRILNAHLDEILDLPESERSARLELLRERDPAFASDLASLLKEQRALEREAFLTEELRSPIAAVLAGQTLGSYTIIAPLGEGGMGEVWLAEQREPVRRNVAIKIIKPGMDTAHVVARFEAERQALALMNHTAVAKVFDAGSTPQGRPYFVMEYVRGVSITQYCDDQRLAVRERLELFMLVCEGVQHAHQKAVIHRDLKPSNVLVTLQDNRPIPKIIDFGLAKATAQRLTQRTLYTGLGTLIGTPEYMSPEQADLTGRDIDTRTDVYSLGVMLYQLLVGVLPFDSDAFRKAGFDEIRRTIREEEPRKPSARLSGLSAADSSETAARRRVDVATFRRLLKGELDWIVMKAIEKDRLRRYGSPAELAADIQRYLENLPVLAGPPDARYRARKFVRRHRVGVAFAMVTLLSVVGFAFAMTVVSARVARERDRANREATTANRALGFLTELFEVSDPSEARGNSITAREMLDRGAAKIDTELKDEPLIQAKLSMTLGKVYEGLGLEASAKPLFEHSLALRRRVLGEDDRDTLTSEESLATVLQEQGQLPEAEKYFREVLVARQARMKDDPDTLVTANNLGLLLQQEGKLKEAEPYLREALDGERRVLKPDDPEFLSSLNNLGLLLQRQGRLAEAEPYLRELVTKCRAMLGNDHPHTLSAINNMALLLFDEGHLEETGPLWSEVLDTRRRVLGPDHPLTLLSVLNMGYLLRTEGKLAEAEPYARDAVEGCRRVLGADHPRTLSALNGMALLLQAQGKLEEAEATHRACLAARRSKVGEDHLDTIDSLLGLASVLHDQRRFAEAEPLLRDALERSHRTQGNDHPMTINVMASLGDLLTSEGQLQEAESLLDEALATARRVLPPGHRIIGRTLLHRGRCLARLGRYPDAEASLVEAHTILEQAEPVLLPRVAKNLEELNTLSRKPE
jgi:eukaryotic-like serine/threonine-protein kinase